MTRIALVYKSDMLGSVAQQRCGVRNRLWAHMGVDATVRTLEADAFLEFVLNPLIFI